MYEAINPGCTMMVNNVGEEKFFLSHLKPEHDVLEWGAGLSTLAISPLVKSLESIEHNKQWFDEMCKKRPHNCSLHYIPLNHEPSKEYSDGTYRDCQAYINFPVAFIQDVSVLPIITHKQYDVIFIDGRARVECAKIAVQKRLLKKDGIIFIHDYNHPDERYRRTEYFEVENFLDRIDGVFAMWKFKPKIYE